MTERVRRGAAVLGSPITHSLSPVLHRTAYSVLGLADWTYRAIECDEGRLAGTLRELEDVGLAGVSLTMPLKRVAAGLVARRDRVAADTGAVNTVLFGGVAGDWWGANTDVPGLVATLRAAGLTHADGSVVLGGGATAASALAALRELGDAAPRVFVRRPGAVAELLRVADRLGVAPSVHGWDEIGEALENAAMVVSTTPVGATDGLAVPPRVTGLLFDVVYAPWPTQFASAWSSAGGRVVGGLELLVAQAAEQVRLMTGLDAPVAEMRAAGEAALPR